MFFFFATKIHQKYPCTICDLEVKNSGTSIQCNLCDKWVHTTSVDIGNDKYEKLQKKSPAMVLPSTKSPPAQSIKLKKIDQEPKES